MLWWLLLGTGSAVFVGYALFASRRNAGLLAKRRQVFQTRACDDVNAWFAQHFKLCGVSQQEAMTVLQPIADAMQCHITQLRPDDSFATTLAFRGITWFGVDDDNPLAQYAEDLVAILGSDQRVGAILEHINRTPTLHSLMYAISKVSEPTESIS